MYIPLQKDIYFSSIFMLAGMHDGGMILMVHVIVYVHNILYL